MNAHADTGFLCSVPAPDGTLWKQDPFSSATRSAMAGVMGRALSSGVKAMRKYSAGGTDSSSRPSSTSFASISIVLPQPREAVRDRRSRLLERRHIVVFAVWSFPNGSFVTVWSQVS